MEMIQLPERQKRILQIISALFQPNNRRILKDLEKDGEKVSRITLVRDLNALLKAGQIEKFGEGRGVYYEAVGGESNAFFDEERYFDKEADKRLIKGQCLDFENLGFWENFIRRDELNRFDQLTKVFSQKVQKIEKYAFKKELERITIEFSWKSSQIEGNTYSLLDTERLINAHQEAKGHTHEEALMILNHKTALEYAWSKPEYFKTINVRKIEEIHSLIAKGLKIPQGIRKSSVGIIGTAYKPYDNQFQLRESLEALCGLINRFKHPLQKALLAVCGLSYIQPFQDGNKRTSRLIGNAILLANNCCPLSYRSADEVLYKKAMIIFYEQHSVSLFKMIFLEQYSFAVKNYF